MSFIKTSISEAIKETLDSKEFKESVKNVVTTAIDESAEVIEKIVSDKEKKDNQKKDDK